VFLQPVAPAKNGALVGQSAKAKAKAKGIELIEFTVQRCVEEGFLHSRV
jgi:hypothetical protein